MIRKNIGFDLQKVTRQSLSSLEEIDKYYLDFVVSRLFDRMANKRNSFFYIDDLELKDYICAMLRHHMITKRMKSHIITLNENTTTLPYDVPFDNCTLLIDIQPNTSELYVQSLAPLVHSCSSKNIRIVILGCIQYQAEFLESFERFDSYDCVLSEHELRQIIQLLNIRCKQNLFKLTSGMPTLLRTWVLASDEDVSYRRSDLFQIALNKALKWFMRDTLTLQQRICRLQMLLVGEDTYEHLSHIPGFEIDEVSSPFTVASGCRISCAATEDILTYRMFLDEHKDMLYGMEAAVLDTLESLYSFNEWEKLARALSILPMNDVIAQYIAKIPFEAINCGRCSLIEKASMYERSLSKSQVIALQMAESTIAGNLESLRYLVGEYRNEPGYDETIANQAEVILQSFSLLSGDVYERIELNTSDPLIDMLQVHCDAINLLSHGQLEVAYEHVLLNENKDKRTFAGQLLELDLMLLALMLGDDSWSKFKNEYQDIIDGLSSSGLVSVNLFVPVINDCIECVFNHDVNSFSLERAISAAQCRGYHLVSSCLLTFSVLYNLHIRNLLKAYTQAQLLSKTSGKCASDFLKSISNILLMLSCKLLEEDIPEDRRISKPSGSPENEVLLLIEDSLLLKEHEHISDFKGCPSGIWWFVFALEHIDEHLVQSLIDAIYPNWAIEYKHYKLRIENLSSNLKEVYEMNKVEEQLIKERNTLYIKIMGTIDIRSSGREVKEDDWSRKAAKMMLLYLAVAENHTLSRADLQELLWPDKDYIAARGNLYTALSSLKKTIGHNDELRPYIKCYEGYISLNPDCVRVDSDTFIRIARKMLDSSTDPDLLFGMYDDLVETFDGGLFIPIGDESGLFQARKESLEGLYLETLMTFAEISLRMRRPRQAVRCAKEILSIDDRREDAFILFMQALHSMGRRAEVVTAYNIFSKNLINKYGIAISPCTRDIYAEIIQDDSRPGMEYRAV